MPSSAASTAASRDLGVPRGGPDLRRERLQRSPVAVVPPLGVADGLPHGVGPAERRGFRGGRPGVREASLVLRRLRIAPPGARGIARALEGLGGGDVGREEHRREGLVLRPGLRPHRLELQPGEPAGGDVGGRPVVAAVEERDAMRRLRLRERRIEGAHLVIVEVAVAAGAEVGHGEAARRRFFGKPRAAGDDAGDRARRLRGEGGGDARAAGEAADVGAAPVDREARVRVVPHRLKRRGIGVVLRVAPRVVRRGEDPAERVGGGAETLDRQEGAPARVEEVEDRRGFAGRPDGRHIEGIRLFRLVAADDLLGERSRAGVARADESPRRARPRGRRRAR